jgi:hypothetical protein
VANSSAPSRAVRRSRARFTKEGTPLFLFFVAAGFFRCVLPVFVTEPAPSLTPTL